MPETSVSVFNPVYKEKITAFLETYITGKQNDFAVVNNWGSDVIEKLQAFISQGKMIRGSLILFMSDAYAGEIKQEAILLAAAIELFHSSLLIHDDIMDNDTVRRGNPTIFAQYQSFAENKKFENAHHFGESMGISVGDICFFLGFKLIAEIGNKTISQLCMQELVSVGLAQMQDVYAGYTKEEVTEKDIEQVYLYKTGRYTFSLPMMMGALVTGETSVTDLEKIGEYVGLIFQHTDDALSLFGKQSETGKIAGSDIRENKKTLYRFYLLENSSAQEKKKLENIFGNHKLTIQEIDFVRDLIKKYKIQEMIDQKIQMLQKQAKEHIIQLQISETYKSALEQMMTYIIERKK